MQATVLRPGWDGRDRGRYRDILRLGGEGGRNERPVAETPETGKVCDHLVGAVEQQVCAGGLTVDTGSQRLKRRAIQPAVLQYRGELGAFDVLGREGR